MNEAVQLKGVRVTGRGPAEPHKLQKVGATPTPAITLRLLSRLVTEELLVRGIAQATARPVQAARQPKDIALSVKVLVQDASGRVLLLDDVGSGFWDLPGGHAQAGETPEQAARREVKEETGLSIDSLKPVGGAVLELRKITPVMFYQTHLTETQPEVAISKEHVGYRWFTTKQVLEVNAGAFDPMLARLLNSHEAKIKPHDRRRVRVKKIYDAAIHVVLDKAKQETLANLHHANKARGGSAAVAIKAAKPIPVAADLLFDLDDFEADFLLQMRSAGESAFKVSSRGLVRDLGNRQKLVAQGVVNDFLIDRENLLKGVPSEIYEDIKADLQAAAVSGATEEEMADAIRDAFDQVYEGRAETVARTETGSVYGAANSAAIAAAGYANKRWLSSHDEFVRNSHQELDGEVIPVDGIYSNGLRYPCDPLGEASETINCRCVEVAEGDAE